MRIQAVALAAEDRRFVRGYPPRGARLFLTPNIEISRLAELTSGTDVLSYIDLRVEPPAFDSNPDLVLVQVDFGQEGIARELARELARRRLVHLFFGPQVTAWREHGPGWLGSCVLGDIAQAWPDIRRDAVTAGLRQRYLASDRPVYFPPRRPFGRWQEMNVMVQVMRFAIGCRCSEAVAPWCPDRLYYGPNRLLRPRDEILGEVLSMPDKRIRLLDDDVASEPDYYEDVFRHVWHYRRHWTVRAGVNLFRHPRLIRLLAKAGVRVVFLDESFLEGRLERAVNDARLLRRLYRCVKTLQSARLLVGARVLVRFEPDRPLDFEPLASVLRRTDLDFIEPRFLVPAAAGGSELHQYGYRPMMTNREPGWLSSRFYAMTPLLSRLARRPRRAGFYTTTRYLLPYSMAYRQDHLETITST